MATTIPTLAASTVDVDAGNSLRQYRNYTYRVTFACIKKEVIGKNQHETFESDPKSHWIIARNYGKGDNDYKTKEDIDRVTRKTNFTDVKSTIRDFLKESPGRFDFYIDNLEIDAVTSMNNQTGMAAYHKIKFDVIEPYSINGFLESLQMSSIAMEYQNYIDAVFVLIIDFVGYLDRNDIDLPPKVVPFTKRRFFIKLTEAEIKINEEGTVYHVTAIPINEYALTSNANKIKKNVQVAGLTVGDLIKSLTNSLNSQKNDLTEGDIYTVKFPKLNTAESGNFRTVEWDSDQNDISKSKVRDPLKLNGLVEFPPVGEINVIDNYGIDVNLQAPPPVVLPPLIATPDASANITISGVLPKFLPAAEVSRELAALASKPLNTLPPKLERVRLDPSTSKPLVQYPENSNITDIITSIVNGSDYFKKIIDRVNEKREFGPNEMIWYYQIQTDIKVLDEFNPTTNRPKYEYIYYVIPYEVHHSRINVTSGIVQLSSGDIDNTRYSKTYRYLYTGYNSDIIDFKMDFNLNFYSAVPISVNRTIDKQTPDKDKQVESKLGINSSSKKTVKGASEKTPVMPYPRSAIRNLNYLNVDAGKTADNYAALAQVIHNSFLQTSGLGKIEMTIIGDTDLIFTSGLGNYRPPIDTKHSNFLTNGEINHRDRDVMIQIIFRNPTDIDKTTGELRFRNKFDTFSGIYRINSISHKFREGVFTQEITALKIQSYAQEEDVPEKSITAGVNRFPKQPTPPPSPERSKLTREYVSADVVVRSLPPPAPIIAIEIPK